MYNNYNTYISAPAPMCQWHQNQNIIGTCNRCGAYVCPECIFLAPDSSQVCPNCFKAEYGARIAENRHLKSTALLFLVLGILFTLGSYVLFIYMLLQKYNINFHEFHLEYWTLAFNELTGGHISIGIIYILLFILSIFCSIGFLFGLRSVGRTVKKLPVIVIIFSVLLCAIGLGIMLQAAWLSGGFIMIRDFKLINKNKKIINTMTQALIAHHI